ncbi:Noranthrone synthase [Lecanosticta acicola]|uniref:Noranthrone synthase n=1 Tax=Lecanosticta acicola TaxID=111012 RepID=A0AAI8YYZ8_9PEZI|nr:Noranthrone synthase [Lecanosticta acicola]
MRGIDTNPNLRKERHQENLQAAAAAAAAAVMASSPNNELFLYDHPVSSYAQKVRMALRFKSLPFQKETPQNLGAGHPDPSFSSANPRLEVPALLDGDFRIFDSTTIVMYLEEKFPEPALFPRDPRERAEARMMDDVCGTHYEAVNWAIGEITWFERAKGDEAKMLIGKAVEQTHQLQAWLEQKLGSKDFFNGSSPGYADIAVAPILNRSVHYGYGPKEGSPLQKWHARISQIPYIKETFDEMAAAAKMMASMGPGTWAKGAGRRREYRDHRLEWMIKNGAIGIVQQGLDDDNIRFSWPHPK